MSQHDGNPPPTPPGQQPAPRRGSPFLPGGWIALIVLGVVAFAFLAFGNRYREIDYSKFKELMDAGELKTVTLLGDTCTKVMNGDVLGVRIIAGCPRVEPR